MPKMHQNMFGGRAPPGPAGGLSAPRPLAANKGLLLLREGEGEGREGERGKGRDCGSGESVYRNTEPISDIFKYRHRYRRRYFIYRKYRNTDK